MFRAHSLASKVGHALLNTIRYLGLNADSMPNYSQHYRDGSRISTGFVESAVTRLSPNGWRRGSRAADETESAYCSKFPQCSNPRPETTTAELRWALVTNPKACCGRTRRSFGINEKLACFLNKEFLMKEDRLTPQRFSIAHDLGCGSQLAPHCLEEEPRPALCLIDPLSIDCLWLGRLFHCRAHVVHSC
jgi:hypothetical protein